MNVDERERNLVERYDAHASAYQTLWAPTLRLASVRLLPELAGALFGTEDLIDPLRDWLEDDPPMVGQSLLLLGSIHNVRIPEEEDILRAIEAERARQEREEPEEEGSSGGPENKGEDYVM